VSRIERFESIAERIVEGTFAKLFAGRLSPIEVATHLARAMEDGQVRSPAGVPRAPTHYRIYLHPTVSAALAREQPGLEEELADQVRSMAAGVGLAVPQRPRVRILVDQTLGTHDVRVEADDAPDERPGVDSTQEMAPGGVVDSGPERPVGRPFLILPGRRHINLLGPVVSIGRALDNDVIVEDPRVSRQHAQLRWRYNRYVLYDLGSRGGTRINGYQVEECVLHSGDVISLGGVAAIYGEDPPTPVLLPDEGDTPPLADRAGDLD
jgi:hypothetical protein